MLVNLQSSIWIESNGGPLLLLPTTLLPYWEGIDSPSGGRTVKAQFRWQGQEGPATDYDRACDVDDYLGLIEVGDGTGLVLDDEPMLTTWRPVDGTRRAGVLIRWEYADNAKQALQSLDGALANSDIWQPEEYTFALTEGSLHLFDAAFAGNELDVNNSLPIELVPGIYSISSTLLRPDPRTSMLLHRLTLNA